MDRTSVINVAGLEHDSISDGPGLRFVLFVQGCPHHCPGCHNPQTHRFGAGRDYGVDELYAMIRSNPLLEGVTFSGGEPFTQAAALAKLARKLKADGCNLAIFSGFTFEQLLRSEELAVRDLLHCADVLVDGKFMLERMDKMLRFRGSGNQRVLDAGASLAARRAVSCSDPEWF